MSSSNIGSKSSIYSGNFNSDISNSSPGSKDSLENKFLGVSKFDNKLISLLPDSSLEDNIFISFKKSGSASATTATSAATASDASSATSATTASASSATASDAAAATATSDAAAATATATSDAAATSATASSASIDSIKFILSNFVCVSNSGIIIIFSSPAFFLSFFGSFLVLNLICFFPLIGSFSIICNDTSLSFNNLNFS